MLSREVKSCVDKDNRIGAQRNIKRKSKFDITQLIKSKILNFDCADGTERCRTGPISQSQLVP